MCSLLKNSFKVVVPFILVDILERTHCLPNRLSIFLIVEWHLYVRKLEVGLCVCVLDLCWLHLFNPQSAPGFLRAEEIVSGVPPTLLLAALSLLKDGFSLTIHSKWNFSDLHSQNFVLIFKILHWQRETTNFLLFSPGKH